MAGAAPADAAAADAGDAAAAAAAVGSDPPGLYRARRENARVRREWARLQQQWADLDRDNAMLRHTVGADQISEWEQQGMGSLRPNPEMAACPLLGGEGADAAAAEDFGDDEVFFGTKRVNLGPAPGTAVPYDHPAWAPAVDPPSLAAARGRARRQGDLSPELADVVVPAIPAVDLAPSTPPGPCPAEWPEFLREPVIKVKEPQPGQPKALASGCRSCCVKLGDRWYRLKGSGNNDEGFIVQPHPAAGGEGAWREIRGAAFVHTSARELYMTSRLDAALRPKGILGANRALGYYQYAEPHLPLGPLVPPACIVEETYGDRRFGSHVCAGLELLLPALVDEARLDVPALLAHFPEQRPGRESVESLVGAAELMTDRMMAFEMGLPGHGLTWPDVARDETALCDLSAFPVPLRAPAEAPPQWTNAGEQAMDPRWRGAWDAAAARVAAGAAGGGRALAYFFSRCGYEAGVLLREMHALRVSWGTYQDAMTRQDLAQWHCNAHANNLVLLREGTSPTSFLSYLDLDMAFTDDTFLNVWAPDAEPGVPAEEYDRLMERENVNFLETLVGADASTGVPQVAKRRVEEQGAALRALRVALYDTLALGYLRGYTQDERYPVAAPDAALHGTAYALARLAAIAMADFVA